MLASKVLGAFFLQLQGGSLFLGSTEAGGGKNAIDIILHRRERFGTKDRYIRHLCKNAMRMTQVDKKYSQL